MEEGMGFLPESGSVEEMGLSAPNGLRRAEPAG